VATIDELRLRSERLFERLLGAESQQPGLGAAADDQRAAKSFAWFDPVQAHDALMLAAELAVRAGSRRRVSAGLSLALDAADLAADQLPAGMVRQALAIFETHHRSARRLVKPRTVAADPGRFAPSRRPSPVATGSSDQNEAKLDYWREDALANEHHDHWHQVYPHSGLPPTDWLQWATDVSRSAAAELLEALEPSGNWAATVDTLTPQELLDEFMSRAEALNGPQLRAFFDSLSSTAYRGLFRINDRQGELFFYMHQQMLARYDAERISVGLSRVTPFGPTQWKQPIVEGYDPVLGTRYGRRDASRQLAPAHVTELSAFHVELNDAITSGGLLGAAATPIAVDRVTIGEATEGTDSRLRDLRPGRYLGIHNWGHSRIAALSVDGPGVMNDPSVAIRDPVFWRWHRYIDGLVEKWQSTLPAEDFSDAPAVKVRNDLQGGTGAWKSPDIILIDTSGVVDPTMLPSTIGAGVGGANWDTDFTDSTIVLPDGSTLPTVGNLTTRFKAGQLIDGTPVMHMTHDAFAYAVRIENSSSAPLLITLRVFIVPQQWAEQRRRWIELDKFIYTASPGRSVAFRADTDLAVIKKPAEYDPSDIHPDGGDPNDAGYCACGWPNPLVLPRGTPTGLRSRVAVMCTDATLDNASPEGLCGSMSFCGAVDRYPDARDMGYPFARPFASSIASTFAALDNAAARSVTITHQP